MGELLRRLNEERPIRRLGVTRRALLEELDRPHLKGLPSEPYSFAEWRLRRVGVDYHVEVEAHFYSVPYRFARSEVEVRLTPRTHRGLSQGRADRRASALQRQSPAHHRLRSHAIQPPALRRLDRRAHSQRSRCDRPRHGCFVRADPGAPPPPRTGLPFLSPHRPPRPPV